MSTYTPTQDPRVARESVGHDRRSLTNLLGELRDECVALVRQEMDLARTETSEKVSRVSRNAIYMGVGGAILFAGLLFLLQALTAGVALWLDNAGVAADTILWLAPLLVGLTVALIGLIFFQKGKSTLKNESLVPEKTVDEIRETKNWAREKTR